MLTINNVPVASPSEMKVEIFDVGPSEERSASGALVADRVAVKRKLTLRWARLTPVRLTALLNAVGDAPFFEASYPDPQTASERTATFRAGARTTGVMRMDGGVPVWTDVRMEWTEK